MFKQLFILFVFICASTNLYAQVVITCTGDSCVAIFVNDQSSLKRIAKVKAGERNSWTIPKGGFGYTNSLTAISIPFTYEFAYPFKNGYAVVSSNGKYGAIDSTGKVVIPLKYALISWVACGSAFYSMKGDKVDGIVNINGTEIPLDPLLGIVKPPTPYTASTAITYPVEDKKGTLYFFGKTLIAFTFSDNIANVNNTFVDRQGKVLFKPAYKAFDCVDGMIMIEKTLPDGTKRYGYLNNAGKLTIVALYTYAEDFKNGEAVVNNTKPGASARNVIDKTGKILRAAQ